MRKQLLVCALAGLLAQAISCSGSIGVDRSNCTVGCPVVTASLVFSVSARDGSDVGRVEATLSGPNTVAMACQNNGFGTACFWPAGISAFPGTYALQVTAPTFQVAKLNATVAITPASNCGCPSGKLDPSEVILDRL